MCININNYYAIYRISLTMREWILIKTKKEENAKYQTDKYCSVYFICNYLVTTKPWI